MLLRDSRSENKTLCRQELLNSEQQSVRLSPMPYDGLSFESISRNFKKEIFNNYVMVI